MRRDPSAVTAAITVGSVVSAYDDSAVMDNHIRAEVSKRSAAALVRDEGDQIQNIRVQSLRPVSLLLDSQAAFRSERVLHPHRCDAATGYRP